MKGFSIVETIIAVAIFAMIGVAMYSMGIAAQKGLRTYRETATVAALADKYMEIARNLPYAKIGTLSGNPHGQLPDVPNALTIVYNNIPYQIYYAVNYVDDPSDGTSPGDTDYKQVKLSVKNTVTNHVTSFLTTIVPLGLEGAASGGALVLSVIDAVGKPVPGATLHITNNALVPPINVTRTTDSTGTWTEVGLPPSANSYHVVATQSGYSSDQTYPSTLANPNPTKPDATVATSTETAISFAIDETSTLAVQTIDQTCRPIPNVDVELQGSKLIGTPNVLKYDQTFTTLGSGYIGLSQPIEWDTYTPIIKTASYMIYGSSPIQQINLLPNTTEQATLMLGPATANSFLAIVKDASTGTPLKGATVTLSDSSFGYSQMLLTSASTIYQSDWSGGSGQADMATPNKYYADDGNVDTTTLPTALRLNKSGGAYAPSGWLISSTFDTGTASSSYILLSWNPTSNAASTTLAFQIATNNDDATWNFAGPDGTSATYYTVPNTTISAVHTNNEYLRYKVFLSTTDPTVTPVLSNVAVDYVSGCYMPGQAMFAGLNSDNNYTLTVSMPGYTTQVIPNISVSRYSSLQILL